MSDNTISITYFKARALGQFARVTLSYLGVPFVNNAIESIDDALRTTLPFGQVPLLRDGDFVVAQSSAISRYIALKYNFAGKDLKEQAKTDEIISAVHGDLLPAIFGNDNEKTKNVIFPRIFGKFENELKEKKYLVGDSYTIADLYVYVAYDYVQFRGFAEDVNATKYPHLEELKKYFESNAGVQKYIQERPETKF